MKPAILKRVWKEVKDVNADFFNLRTVISVDFIDDDVARFYFMMLPNDGAMAHLTLVGIFHIIDEYPVSPPVVHLFTPTQRWNLHTCGFDTSQKIPRYSSVCFDILRSQAAGGIWKPEYTLSSLFASLMSAIVSFYVAQQYGPDHPEYISMSSLASVKEKAKLVYEHHKSHLPEIPKLPLVEATTVSEKSLFAPQEIIVGYHENVTSEPIYLQTGSDEVYSFAIDLSGLHEHIVFSVILTNQKEPTDLTGRKADTILVRNGVTATAARKVANGETVWFYHGKPMNDGDMRLHVTIGRDQMTFAYYEDGRLYVHGDCPVSRLSEDHIGDVKGVPFYVHIYTKNKTVRPKPQKVQKMSKVNADVPNNKKDRKEARKKKWQAKGDVAEIDEQKSSESSKAMEKAVPIEAAPFPEDEDVKFILKVLHIDGKGYIHESTGEDERKEYGFEFVQHSDTVSDQDTDGSSAQDQELSSVLKKMGLV